MMAFFISTAIRSLRISSQLLALWVCLARVAIGETPRRHISVVSSSFTHATETPIQWDSASRTLSTSIQCGRRRSNLLAVRGGGDGESSALDTTALEVSPTSSTDLDHDEERYSRQVYTLGTRAHGLIRSSVVYLDGPLTSGLLYETAKNLALSGVGRIVVLAASSDEADRHYHNAALDDLGAAYQRAAQSEVGGGVDNDEDLLELLVGYIRRLNPSVVVSTLKQRSQLTSDHNEPMDTRPLVLVSVDRPYRTQEALNHIARAHPRGMSFVAVETAGVYGRLFCDFGSEFVVLDADGETPLVTPLDRMEHSSTDSSTTVVVHAVEGEKHDVSKGDIVGFQLRDGSNAECQLEVTKVHSPHRFEGTLVSNDPPDIPKVLDRINQEASTFRRIKIPKALSFLSVDRAVASSSTDASLFTASDLDKSFDDDRRNAVFFGFQALSDFVARHGKLPEFQDFEAFETLQVEWNSQGGQPSKDFRYHSKRFLKGCNAKFVPLQCIFGAIGAQEAIKAVSGLYFPTHQFLLYDTDEVLPVDFPDGEEVVGEADLPVQAPGMRRLFGKSIVDKLQTKRIFVVGAGAIGCELLKNLAAMGIATRKKGTIHVTDMDTIEKSNLSRQLLFRDSDIGKFKSAAAQQATLRYNPQMKIESHSSKVGGSDHSPFDSHFWSRRVDIVLNALDNVEARLYMDSQCVANEKALVDAGTMGPKGNVQVIVPHQSESYASSVDPHEPSVPVCTLKNFPYAIAHTIQWARDLFDGLYTRRPNQANDFLDTLPNSGTAQRAKALIQEKGEEAALQAAEELSEDLAYGKETELNLDILRQRSLTWASALAVKMFHQAAVDLMKEHPIESLDEDGQPFWTGTRRPPKILTYKVSSNDPEQVTVNSMLVEFVRAAARLRLESIYSVPNCVVTGFSIEEAQSVLASVSYPDIAHVDDAGLSTIERITALLARVAGTSPSQRHTSIEFEKDDDANGHVTFVSAASNLRAIAYGIPPVEAMETRRVAGNIVPAVRGFACSCLPCWLLLAHSALFRMQMITTTAFVSALSCVELVKLAQKAPLSRHRNAFINLALPFFAFTTPLPAEELQGLRGETYTLWDRVNIKEEEKAADSGGITVRALIQQLKQQTSHDDTDSVDVASISCGPYMLYANFLHSDDENILGASIWDLLGDVSAVADDFDEGRAEDRPPNPVEMDFSTFADLTIVMEDLETGEEVEIPVVRVSRYISK